MSHLLIFNSDPNEGSKAPKYIKCVCVCLCMKRDRMIAWAKETIEWNSYLNYRGIDSLNDRIIGITEHGIQTMVHIVWAVCNLCMLRTRFVSHAMMRRRRSSAYKIIDLTKIVLYINWNTASDFRWEFMTIKSKMHTIDIIFIFDMCINGNVRLVSISLQFAMRKQWTAIQYIWLWEMHHFQI